MFAAPIRAASAEGGRIEASKALNGVEYEDVPSPDDRGSGGAS